MLLDLEASLSSCLFRAYLKMSAKRKRFFQKRGEENKTMFPSGGDLKKSPNSRRELIMGYGRSFSGGRSSGRGYRGGGFTNSRTGSYVSSARAHQHVGQSLGGYTKSQSGSSGNYYMRKSK